MHRTATVLILALLAVGATAASGAAAPAWAADVARAYDSMNDELSTYGTTPAEPTGSALVDMEALALRLARARVEARLDPTTVPLDPPGTLTAALQELLADLEARQDVWAETLPADLQTVQRAMPAYIVTGHQEGHQQTFSQADGARWQHHVARLGLLEMQRVLLDHFPPEPSGAASLSPEDVVVLREGVPYTNDRNDLDVYYPDQRARAALEEGRSLDALGYTLVAAHGYVHGRLRDPALETAVPPTDDLMQALARTADDRDQLMVERYHQHAELALAQEREPVAQIMVVAEPAAWLTAYADISGAPVPGAPDAPWAWLAGALVLAALAQFVRRRRKSAGIGLDSSGT